MPHDLGQLVAAGTADFEAFDNGTGRARETLAAIETKLAWGDAAPLNHGDTMTIKATFDGEEREFFVKPEHASIFDACMPGGSAYACLQRFIDKSWTTDDVASVLSFALYGPNAKARLAHDMTKLAKQMGTATIAVAYSPHPEVVKVVTRDGAANYATIAVDVLTSVLFREVQEADPEAANG